MQIIIDMDGTICTEERMFSRSLAKPLPGSVENVNKLYNEGHTIIIYTARTWMEFEMTTEWLKNNGVQYHQLMMGKPVGDFWIDDRALNFNNNWEQISEVINKKKK
ncbi:HAD hydrolase family protein [Cytophaga aurantiaca]|uniref:HAD hydrolase family protein n=1 Tax=Cytophaga aurantiaca TaxID=29530 RepID=UPI00037A9A36|nr:HAD hydrolase family protein [Cytophaga aurantiaca]